MTYEVRTMAREKIMIVEEDLLAASRLEDTLTRRGYEVVGTIDSVNNAISMVKYMPLDIMLLDITLNEPQNGVTISSEILSRTDLLVIYMLPYTDKYLVDRSKYFRPYGFLVKPFDEKNLLAIIRRALIWRAWGKISLDNMSQYFSLFQEASDPGVIETGSSMMSAKKSGYQRKEVEGIAS